jgi:pentapeptide repeat protein
MTMHAADTLGEKKARPSAGWRPQRSPQPMPGRHVEVLRAGARAWNRWRREHPGVVPVLNDLRVSVSERQFGPVQGGPVNLSRAELCRARLDQATLVQANLMGAVLTEADLSDARLDEADLRGARLAGAHLQGAQLEGANLRGADLRLAKGLAQAQIEQAIGDRRTLLPSHLAVPSAWLEDHLLPGDGPAAQRITEAAADVPSLDPYAILGVNRGDSLADIRVAWLKVVKDLQPEASARVTPAVARLQAIDEAYRKLKDLDQVARNAPATRGLHGRSTTVIAALLIAALGALVLGLETYLARPPGDDATAEARIGDARRAP